MMEEYTDICSLLGLDSAEAGLHDKQTIIEETLSDPSDLLDFLVSQEFREDCGYRGSYSASLLSNLNIDINLNINDLSHSDRSGLAWLDEGSGACDLIDSESDSGVESESAPSPGDGSNLPLSSIQAMLPDTPLPIRELSYLSSLSGLDTGEMVAVPPRLLIKQDKKPSLLSTILARPPIETAASRQLSSLLSCKHSTSVSAPGNTAQNFSVFDSLKQKDNGRADLTVRTLPTPHSEGDQGGTCSNGDVRQIPARKKLIINKRKKEIIHTQRESKRLHQEEMSSMSLPWDGDLRSPMISCEGGGVSPPVTTCVRPAAKLDKTFICPTCEASFPTSSARSCHRRQVHQRHHLCVSCDRAFTTQQKLERHLKTHRTESKKTKCEKVGPEDQSGSDKKRFECGLCPGEYFTKGGLTHHQNSIHSNEMQLSCSRCEFVGKTRSELENHFGVNHHHHHHQHQPAQSIQPFRNSLEDTTSHQMALDGSLDEETVGVGHQLNRSNQCNHCGRKFAFKNSLTKHLSKGRCVILKKSQHQPIPF